MGEQKNWGTVPGLEASDGHLHVADPDRQLLAAYSDEPLQAAGADWQERVVIPEGITRMASMMLDSNSRTWRRKKTRRAFPRSFRCVDMTASGRLSFRLRRIFLMMTDIARSPRTGSAALCGIILQNVRKSAFTA